MRVAAAVLFTCLLVLLAGCHTFGGAPRIQSATVTPEVLAPDSTGLIRVALDDAYGLVRRVEGEVAVEPPVRIPLFDDGTHGDEKAADGIWSYEVKVPFNAPPGSHEVVFTAYGADGLPVEVRTKEEGVVPLQAGIPVVVAYPKE